MEIKKNELSVGSILQITSGKNIGKYCKFVRYNSIDDSIVLACEMHDEPSNKTCRISLMRNDNMNAFPTFRVVSK